MTALGLFVTIWAAFAGMVFILGPLIADEWDLPTNQKVAAVLLIGLVAPLTVPVLLCVGLYKGVPWLARGFSGLWRRFFPKTNLPRAVVHDERD